MKTLLSFPRETPESFPAKAARGSAVVTIYRKTHVKPQGRYEEYLIPYKDGIARRFHSYPEYDSAREKANDLLDLLVAGEANAITLKDKDKAIYNDAIAAVLPTGVRLDHAARDFAHYWQQMGGDFYKEAISQYVERRNTVKPINTPSLVRAFIEQKTSSTKRSRPASPDYIKDLEARLGQFAEQFVGPVTGIKPDDVLEYLDSLKIGTRHVSARTRFNHARLLGTLFRFAQSRKYLPKDIDLMEGIETEFDDDGEIEIFSADELRRVLNSAREDLIPFLAISAFAGLRHAEVKRLEWQEIDLDRRFIEVKGAKAKTRQRRLIPISDNLKDWLTPHQKQSGPVVRFANCSKQIDWLVSAMNEAAPEQTFKWKRNGLRHSFISYRLAQIQHADQVALEAGNSPQMIFKHYRELVRPEQAKEYFSIVPPSQ